MSGNRTYQVVSVTPAGSDASLILGVNVTRYRKREKINKTRFSAMLGIGRPTLNAIENGVGNPRLDLIERMAHALNVEMLDLLTFPEDDLASTLRLNALREKNRKAALAKLLGN